MSTETQIQELYSLASYDGYDFDMVIADSIGEEAGTLHYESLAAAILEEDWLEVGRLIGPKAKSYLESEIARFESDPDMWRGD